MDTMIAVPGSESYLLPLRSRRSPKLSPSSYSKYLPPRWGLAPEATFPTVSFDIPSCSLYYIFKHGMSVIASVSDAEAEAATSLYIAVSLL